MNNDSKNFALSAATYMSTKMTLLWKPRNFMPAKINDSKVVSRSKTEVVLMSLCMIPFYQIHFDQMRVCIKW